MAGDSEADAQRYGALDDDDTVTSKSMVIYVGPHYTACAMSDGKLVISRNRKGGGRYLDGAEAAKWAEAIRTAHDATEAHMLCSAILSA